MYLFAVHRVLLLALLVLLGILGISGEKIPVNNHTGWDGKHYANLTIQFEELAGQKQIDSYQYQRVLTPVVIHYTAKATGFKLTPENIVSAFSVYNFILIIACALLFFDLCFSLQIKQAIEIIGFSGLFFNYFILKNTGYYPVLTDCTAFFMGCCVTWLFIKQKNNLLFVVSLIGQFCYPLFLVASLPLALAIRNNTITHFLQRFYLYNIGAGICILLVLAGLYPILFIPNTLLPQYTLELNKLFLPLSIGLVGFYLWRSITLFTGIPTLQLNTLSWKILLAKTLGIFAFIYVTNHIIRQISIPEEVFTPIVFVYNILQQSIDNPLVFLIAHITYLGPALILLLIFYKPVLKTVVALGDSAIAYFILLLVLSIGSETRQFIHFYPFIIVVLVITLNQYQINLSLAIVFSGLSLLASKCWFPINREGSFIQYLYGQFPDQYYFMNHGPFMSDASYAINTGIVVLQGLLIWKLFLATKRQRSNSADQISA